MAELTRPAVPVEYGVLIRDVAAEHGVDTDALLASAAIDPALLDEPGARLTGLQAGALLLQARELTGEPGVGYLIGLSSSLTSHGLMGYGLLSSTSVADAIALGEKYLPLRLPMMGMSLTDDGTTAAIEVVETVPTGPVRDCLIDLFLVGLSRMAPILTAHRGRPEDVELWFDRPEPEHYARFADRLPTARFATGVNQVRFPSADLALTSETANPATARVIEDQFRRELEQIGLDADLVTTVRAAVRACLRDGAPLEAVAARLNVSGRTLKRRLSAHGTTYRRQVDAVRLHEAIQLLESTAWTIAQIAERLGYFDASSFSRAFTAWTSTTPGSFRSDRLSRP